MDFKKQDPSIYCTQEKYFRPKDRCKLKVKGWKSTYHVNTSEKKARVRILISDTTGFKTKTGTRHKEGHYMILKQTIDKNI